MAPLHDADFQTTVLTTLARIDERQINFSEKLDEIKESQEKHNVRISALEAHKNLIMGKVSVVAIVVTLIVTALIAFADNVWRDRQNALQKPSPYQVQQPK